MIDPKSRWPRASPLLSNLAYLTALQAPDGQTLEDLINRRYDTAMYLKGLDEYYEHSGFHNYGYWTPETSSQREASENLVDMLVRFFSHKNGNVLDVACGMGASTKRLLRQYDPSNVIGINISEKQLVTSRRRAPGCRFLNMDAAHLRFPDDSFDNILCVEAAFHFDTRENFLREAFRVLKPGGTLALSDILFRSIFFATSPSRIPLANHVLNVEQYRSLYERIEFKDVRIIEARAECWKGFRDHFFRRACDKVLAGEASPARLRMIAARLRAADWIFSNYLLVGARKPHRGSPHGGQR